MDEEENPKPVKRKYRKRIKLEPDANSENEIEKASALITESQVMPVERETWQKHSKFLKQYIKSIDRDPRSWSTMDVCKLVCSLPGIDLDLSETLEREEIDGESLLLLSQHDIINILEIKVGPAVKLYNIIALLRQQIKEGMFS